MLLSRATIAAAFIIALAPYVEAAPRSPPSSVSANPFADRQRSKSDGDRDVGGDDQAGGDAREPAERAATNAAAAAAGSGAGAPAAAGDLDTEAAADDDDVSEGDDAPGASLRSLACLEGEGGADGDGARRGVQKRDFLKKRRLEISALGGFVAWDALSSTYGYGGGLSFFLAEDFGIEALVMRTPMQFRLEEAFTTFAAGERHFTPGAAWSGLAAMLWSPVHAKLRWSERRITHADLFLVAGAGRTLHDTIQGLTFQAGFGLKFYLARYFSLRFDARDLMAPQDVLGRSRLTHNLVLLFGLSGWFPG